MLTKDKKIEQLQQKLNEMITCDAVNQRELIRASQELDVLIVQSMKQKADEKEVYPYESELAAVFQKLDLFRYMYDDIRIVDPLRKSVITIKNKKLVKTEAACHNFWEKGQICHNCIAIKALMESNSMVKIDYTPEGIYMVTAIPITINKGQFVVEIMKNVSNSLFFGNTDPNESVKIVHGLEAANRLAVYDALTGIHNCRYIEERLPADIIHAAAYKEPLSIVFADIDYFKRVNDTYGHVVGDKVIKAFAEQLKKHIRKERDWVARFGGEEFMICLTNTDYASARKTAERIRAAIEKKRFIIALADQKLYEAKKKGRNRVE